MQKHPLIEINPKIMMGKPVIKGTRITTELIIEKISAGETIDEILDSYPHLNKEVIEAALAFANDGEYQYGKQVQLNNSLEQIENDYWPEPDDNSHLVIQSHQLRKKPLKNFLVEDLRILIGQNISLKILIPLAIQQLKKNILAEGDLYKGDLLKSVLSSDETYWITYPFYWKVVESLFERQRAMFESENSFKQILKAFERFAKIHT